MQTVEIKIRAVSSGFSLFASFLYFLIPKIKKNETNKVAVQIYLMSEVTCLYPSTCKLLLAHLSSKCSKWSFCNQSLSVVRKRFPS